MNCPSCGTADYMPPAVFGASCVNPACLYFRGGVALGQKFTKSGKVLPSPEGQEHPDYPGFVLWETSPGNRGFLWLRSCNTNLVLHRGRSHVNWYAGPEISVVRGSGFALPWELGSTPGEAVANYIAEWGEP